jgi:hypothetical protein
MTLSSSSFFSPSSQENQFATENDCTLEMGIPQKGMCADFYKVNTSIDTLKYDLCRCIIAI